MYIADRRDGRWFQGLDAGALAGADALRRAVA
jgi:hypothetical protein